MIARDGGMGMQCYFLLAAVGLFVAALSGAALAWDGGVFLFQLLDDQSPFVPHGRAVHVFLQIPTLALSQLTGDLTVLRTAFGLVYAAVPFLAMVASWWVVRPHAPTLFIWAAFGLGFGMLPGQFLLVGESNLAVVLFWPIALAILTGIRRRHVPLVILLAALVMISHPIASPLFAVAAGLAFSVGLRAVGRRRTMWRWALVFGVLALMAALRVWLFHTEYEAEQASLETLRWAFTVAVAGSPLLALTCAWVAGLMVFIAPFAGRRRRVTVALRAIELLSIAMATAVLIRWAIDPEQWRWELKYGYWAPVASLSFLGLAALEVLMRGGAPEKAVRAVAVSGIDSLRGLAWSHRVGTAQLVALACSLVLIVQSTAWLRLSNRLSETMARSGWSCVAMSRIGWIEDTPLHSFATPAYSLLLQSRTPQKVVLDGDECGTETFADGVALHPFATHELGKGWFNLRPLAQQLDVEQDTPRGGCTFGLTTGWHQTEIDDPYWWRWSDGRDARLRMVVAEAGTAMLDGQIEVAQTPDRIDVLVNGERQATLDVAWQGLRPFGLLAIPLQPGINTVRLVSQNAPVEIDRRPLGIGVANLTATYGERAATCTLHP